MPFAFGMPIGYRPAEAGDEADEDLGLRKLRDGEKQCGGSQQALDQVHGTCLS